VGLPWDIARRQHVEVHDGPESPLDADRRRSASASGLTAYWIVPVPDANGGRPALITVWGGPAGRPPEGHAYGMSVARTFVELILRWSHQVQLLDSAAHTDVLTGLANRKAFFDRLDATADRGALLYCDLDRFKPVNDELGHAAGDDLLRQVAGRLRRTVRTGDLVARLGGDEFAVLCEGASTAQAEELAARIEAAFAEPFALDGRAVEIGISIGIGDAPDRLGDDTLEAADQALYRVKARRRAGDRADP
jgi:diguanylate cyclase (GGDEF)-like protein